MFNVKKDNKSIFAFWDKEDIKMKINKGIIICGIEGFSKSYFEMLRK